MDTYKALKIIESYRQLLTEIGIVICTVITEEYEECDCIDIEHQNQYPQFEVITVLLQKDEG